MIFFAACAANQADLVVEEARKAGSEDVRQTSSGVEFEGTVETGMRFCMYSRVASRLLMALYIDEDTESDEELYESTLALPWENWINPETTIKITCTSQACRWIRNSHYAALKVKDAICDHIKEKYDGVRPDVNIDDPDITIHVHIHDRTVVWYADFSGEGLHQRGYRDDQTDAVLKEHLAAALISRSEWKKTVNDGNPGVFLDPFCGSGTIAIEAAQIACGIAPGLNRSFGFEKLHIFDMQEWREMKEDAKAEVNLHAKLNIRASDISTIVVGKAQANAQRAGLQTLLDDGRLSFSQCDAREVAPSSEKGFIVTNPPYGEQSNPKSATVGSMMKNVADNLKKQFSGWTAWMLTSDRKLPSQMRLSESRKIVIFNGPLECRFFKFEMVSGSFRNKKAVSGEN